MEGTEIKTEPKVEPFMPYVQKVKLEREFVEGDIQHSIQHRVAFAKDIVDLMAMQQAMNKKNLMLQLSNLIISIFIFIFLIVIVVLK